MKGINEALREYKEGRPTSHADKIERIDCVRDAVGFIINYEAAKPAESMNNLYVNGRIVLDNLRYAFETALPWALIKCDAENNPPSTKAGTAVVRVSWEDSHICSTSFEFTCGPNDKNLKI